MRLDHVLKGLHAAGSLAGIIGAVFGCLALFPEIAEAVKYKIRMSDAQSVEDLRASDCVRVTETSETDPAFPESRSSRTQYELVNCDQAHDRQVIAVLTRPGSTGDAMPDASIWNQMCVQAYGAFVRDDIEPMHFSYDAPTESSWGTGDRKLVCFVTGDSGKGLLGSALRS